MRKIILLMGLVSLVSLMGRTVLAADVASTYKVADNQAVFGDILINSSSGFIRTKIPYDNSLFGVLVETSSLIFRSGDPADKPVVQSGTAIVNVVATNGDIKNGDYITSSETLGKGMKATRSGYVLGVALSEFSGSGDGQISVAVRVEYAELTTTRNANRLLELLGSSFLTNVKDPEKFGQVVRYITAGLVLLVSFGFGFITFSRSLPRGIEAIGRNPLAKNTIYLSMAINVGLIAIVGIMGIVGALLILRI